MDKLDKIINNAKPLEITENQKECLKSTYLDLSLLVEQISQNIDKYVIPNKKFKYINVIGEQCSIELEKLLEQIRTLNTAE